MFLDFLWAIIGKIVFFYGGDRREKLFSQASFEGGRGKVSRFGGKRQQRGERCADQA